MHIEVLAKELELYKTKSAGELQRKINALESKTKIEVRNLKTENQHLRETITFKDEKINELQEEIERLRTIMKVDTVQTKKEIANRPNKSVLEKRIEEVAEKGKLEYNVYVSDKSFNKLSNLSPVSLMKGIKVQAKLLDQKMLGKKERVVKDNTKIMKKFEELTKERNELEVLLNKVLVHEKKLQANFEKLKGNPKQLIKVKEDWKTSLKYSAEDEDKVGLSYSPVSSIVNTAVKDIGPEVEVIHSASMATLNKLISEGRLVEATKSMKEANYEFNTENLEEVVHNLILLCKVKDKQIKNLKSIIGKKEYNKCINLHGDDINDLMNEYEAMKEKYYIEPVEDNDIEKLKEDLEQQIELNGDLSEELNEYKNELAKLEESKKNIEEESEKAIRELEEENKNIVKQLQESKKMIEKLQNKRVTTEETTIRLEGNKQLAKLQASNIELAKELNGSKEINTKLREANKAMTAEIEKYKNTIKSLEEANKDSVLSLEGTNNELKDQLENRVKENEELKKDLEKRKQEIIELKETNSSIAKKLEEHTPEVTKEIEEVFNREDQDFMFNFQLSQFEDINSLIEEYKLNMKVLNELAKSPELNKALHKQVKTFEKALNELSSVESLLEDLSIEHRATISKFKQTITNTKSNTLYEFLLNELQAARQITFLTNALLLEMANTPLNKGTINKCYNSNADIRTTASEIYKSFFMSIRDNPMTIESLMKSLNESGNKFKELYKLYEKTLEINNVLMMSLSFSKGQNENANDESIEKLLKEVKGLREIVSFQRRTIHPQKLTAEEILKEKIELLEGKLHIANSKITGYETQLAKASEIIKQREDEIEKLKAEIKKEVYIEPTANQIPSTSQLHALKELEEKLTYTHNELEAKKKENEELMKANSQLIQELSENTLSRRSSSKIQSGIIHKNANTKTPKPSRNNSNKYSFLLTARYSNSGSLRNQRQKGKILKTSLNKTEGQFYKSMNTIVKDIEYEDLFESIQEPLKFIKKVLIEVYDEQVLQEEGKLSLEEIKEIIMHGSELIRELRSEVENKSKELEKINELLQEERWKQSELSRKVLELKASQNRTHRFEIPEPRKHITQLKTPTKDKRNYANELEEALKLLRTYREELEQCKAKIDELIVQKAGLEECNNKANMKIRALLERHQKDRETQSQLLSELEALRVELGIYKQSS